MTVIRPNSVSGINSITAQADEIKVFKSNGTQGGLIIGGANLNATSGISTLSALNVTGNVSIAGTLTYQDVTNIDSVGIITARSTIDAQGDVFIADKIVHSGDTNTAIRFLTNDTITAETNGSERLRIMSNGNIGIGTVNAGAPLHIQSNNAGFTIRRSGQYLDFDGNFGAGGDQAIIGSGGIRFYTSGYSNMRAIIDSSGRVLIGTSTEGAGAADRLTIASSATAGMTIRSGASNQGNIYFSDGTSGLDEYRGIVRYDHSNNSMSFRTDATERLRIASNGQVSISSDGTTDGLLTIKGNSDQINIPSIRLLDGSDTREVSISNTAGDFVASVHGNDNAIHGHIKMFESGQIDFNNGGASGSNTNRLRIATDGTTTASGTSDGVLQLTTTDSRGAFIRFGQGGTYHNMVGCADGLTNGDKEDLGVRAADNVIFAAGGSTERMRIASTGYVGINRTSPTHYIDVDGTSLFRNRVFVSTGLRMKSTPFGANVTYDTGISVNSGGYGGSILAICSKNYGAGTNTQSGVYLIKFQYDGNNDPSITLIAGSNLATFGKSGSNTLTVAMGPSNNMFTAIESSVVNA